jgi:hypothetical protein
MAGRLDLPLELPELPFCESGKVARPSREFSGAGVIMVCRSFGTKDNTESYIASVVSMLLTAV